MTKLENTFKTLYSSPMRLFSYFRDYPKKYAYPILHTKDDTDCRAMNHLNICFKHAAALGLNVDL